MASTPRPCPPSSLESPPNRELGDLGTPVAFELARRLRKAPRAIAAGDRRRLGRSVPGVRAGRGRPERLPQLLSRPAGVSASSACGAPAAPRRAAAGKAIVEHTAINPNKAAHIGHLRNAALGDTLVRVLRFRGTPVEVQNYIDDTGVQVADVVVGFRELEQQVARRDPRRSPTRRASTTTAGTSTRASPSGTTATRSGWRIRAATLHDIEHGGNDNAAAAAFIADRIVRCHLKTMARMNVDYDLLTWEGDILRLKFWAQAFDVLKAKGAVYLRTDGPPRRLLGDADPGGSRRRRRQPTAPGVTPEGLMDAGPTDEDADDGAREGHRPLERRRHLRRQGHRLPVLEAGAARARLPLPRVRRAARRAAVGDLQHRRRAPAIRRSAARRTSTTSSTSGSRTCRSC